jgi:hypothetical protein
MTREQALVSAELRRLMMHISTTYTYLNDLNGSSITPVPLEVFTMLSDIETMVEKSEGEYEKLLQRDH